MTKSGSYDLAKIGRLAFGGSSRSEAKVERAAAGFGVAMMLLALLLPFAHAERPLEGWLTAGQIALWFSFCSVWLLLGYLVERSGVGFSYKRPEAKGGGLRGKAPEALVFLLLLGPLCFGYLYVTHLNTGYFGFNYVLMFVVAGFAPLVFPLWLALVYVLYQGLFFYAVAHLMWGVWMEVDDIVTTLSGFLFSAMMFHLFRRERESRRKAIELSEKLDTANEKLRQFSSKVEELAATQERNRIAREIHDTIGHALTVVNMQLETAKALAEQDPMRAVSFLEKAQAVTKRGLEEIRGSVASLRSSPVDGRGLEAALKALLSEMEVAGVEAAFTVAGTPRPVSPQVEAALYRSAQEALTNARKHARAKRVGMELRYGTEGEVELAVRDDGVGCEKAEGGFGIMGIRERIQLLDGAMRLESAPGKGLELRLTIPA